MVGHWTRLGLALVLGLGACAGRVRPLGDPERWADQECVATFTLSHEDGPLAELRELGGTRASVQELFPAAVIHPQQQRPVTAAAKLRFEGQPIAWWSPALDAVVLDGAVFAPLRHVDALSLEPGGRPKLVGRVMERGREALGERAVVELLLRVEAIGTYRHLGADLCMSAEQAQDGSYRAELRGVHQVLDDRVRELGLAFGVEIDPDGVISVVELGAPS